MCRSVQVHVLQEQLSVEVSARTDAQAQVQRLLQQNTDLLQHISLLVRQIQELELKASGQLTSSELSLHTTSSSFTLCGLFCVVASNFSLFMFPPLLISVKNTPSPFISSPLHHFHSSPPSCCYDSFIHQRIQSGSLGAFYHWQYSAACESPARTSSHSIEFHLLLTSGHD